MSEGEKIQKLLAANGVASRREAERLIAAGRVLVDGQPAHIGQRLSGKEKIEVDGKRVRVEELDRRRVIVYHKREGEVCTRSDPEGRPTVFDNLPSMRGERLISVGRLDINTSGLLLFTNDGELANRLMHPRYNMDREYAVRIHGDVTDEMIERLKEGVWLEDGMAKFTDVRAANNDTDRTNHWFYVALLEGRNREVRRLWESQGVEVSRLKRVRYGPVFIPSHLTQGSWLELPPKDVSVLLREVELAGERAKLKPEELKQFKRQNDRLRRRAERGRRTKR
ncbi:MAG: rRNA pseudouridine synthase [Gammaproteobacteria bacterium]|jgi:23S rRNA pseudouridine2605 synthase|nr:rRNA pseudouridine synthase [Gammaproteobacteria bacterium]